MMTETLSIRIDSKTKSGWRNSLFALVDRSHFSLPAISAYVELESWQLGEIESGLNELDSGQSVSNEKVLKWLKSWGKPDEGKAPLFRQSGLAERSGI